MKTKAIQILIIATLLIGCSSSSNDEQVNNINVNLTSQKTTYVVDELAKIQVTATKPIWQIEYSTDNFETKGTLQYTEMPTTIDVYANTAFLGNTTVYIRVTDEERKVAISSLTIEVEKGEAVNIKEVIVNSFKDKDNTWDAEFANTDPNRLADVYFTLIEPMKNPFGNGYSENVWYKSQVKQNQGDLSWDIASDNLYVNPNNIVKFGLADDDGGGVSQDLLLTPTFTRDLNLPQLISTQPETTKISDTDAELDVDFVLSW